MNVELCPSGAHVMHFKMIHITRLIIASSIIDTAGTSLTSGHVETLFCVHCGYIAEKKYVVYRYSKQGDLVAMLSLGGGGTV